MSTSSDDDTLVYDLIIVGAGIVGAALAGLLAKLPIKIALVDALDWDETHSENQFDPRVVALSLRAQEILESFGAWPDKNYRACAYTNMHVWDREGTGQIDFDASGLGQDRLGTIIENSVLLGCIKRQLRQSKSISLYPLQAAESLTLEQNQSLISLEDGTRLQASIVIAADGGNSKLRELSGLASLGWDYGQTAIVTTVKHKFSHKFSAWQSFSVDGPLAFLPLSVTGEDSDTSSIVWSISSSLAEELFALDAPAFGKQLFNSIEGRLGEIVEVDQRYRFPLKQSHAKRYVKPGFALVGDAAHRIHPLAGQGVNLGLYDVQVLAGELERALTRQIPFNDFSILRRYERKRIAHNLLATASMEGFKQLFGAEALGVRWLRNSGMSFLNQQNVIKQKFIQMANGY